MRRFFLTLTLLVLACAVANLVVAIVATRPGRVPRVQLTNVFGLEAQQRGWPAPPPGPWPSVSQWSDTRAFAFRRRDAWSGDASTTTHQMEVQDFGWPLPVLKQVRLWWPWDDPKWTSSAARDSGLLFSWSGALLNPLLLAAILWTLLFAPFTVWDRLRARRRRRRGQCTRCAYPLGESSVCPECGTRP